ncbi:hypothetical protein HL658_16295 [Azospirillum sp. RWY-5-1]|uniref:Uncharacterized protein n=1 Tax=Azospirillum oleiclasticum TaxID=2735135 RepID=A0ABX2TBD6_9PROT|nr:hypothetical protein [Azospirillum oleiclasticum]NYZ14116.1 hypothetical protein [Azospirillum oleiclasticum]NYZ21600.1 hypothetical protein [Azospirillum oleiclasticum]
MSVTFASNWQDPTGIVVLDHLVVQRVLWQAPEPVGSVARAKRGTRDCFVMRVRSPLHGLANRSLQGTELMVELSGEEMPTARYRIRLALVPSNPMILDVTPESIPE